MTVKHTSTRETMLLPNPAPSPKILFPNPTPTLPRKNQTKRKNETWITTQSSTKIRPHYWHTVPPAGRAMTNPVRMIFCCSGESCRRNNGTSLQNFGDLIGGPVAAVRVPVRIEHSSSSRTTLRIRLHRNGVGGSSPEKRNKQARWLIVLSVAWEGERFGSRPLLIYIFYVPISIV